HVTGNDLAHRHHRIARFPAFDLTGGAIASALVGSGADMATEKIGLDLNEMRALAGADPRQQALEHAAQQLRVVAVKLLDGEAEGFDALSQLRHRLAAFDRGMRRVLVVLADDQQREVMQGREVENLVSAAFVENAVPDHRYADVVDATIFLRER